MCLVGRVRVRRREMMVGLRVWLMRVLSTSLNNHDDTSSTMPSLSGLRMLLIEEEQTITNTNSKLAFLSTTYHRGTNRATRDR